jgi:hypothetical protein
MSDLGRVVVVAAGFALWSGGRCVAAARWTDVRRIRAYRRDVGTSDSLRVSVELVDGSLMELHEEAPGFDAFLDRAAATMPTLLPYRDWHHTLTAAPAGSEGITIFERTPRRY